MRTLKEAGFAWVLVVALLGCGGDEPQPAEPDPRPQWINVSGVYSGVPVSMVPVSLGAHQCGDGTTAPVTIGTARITLLDVSPDPSVADPVEARFGIGLGICGVVRSSVNGDRTGTYRAREDSIFFAWDSDAPFSVVGRWAASGTEFRARFRYEGNETELLYRR